MILLIFLFVSSRHAHCFFFSSLFLCICCCFFSNFCYFRLIVFSMSYNLFISLHPRNYFHRILTAFFYRILLVFCMRMFSKKRRKVKEHQMRFNFLKWSFVFYFWQCIAIWFWSAFWSSAECIVIWFAGHKLAAQLISFGSIVWKPDK